MLTVTNDGIYAYVGERGREHHCVPGTLLDAIHVWLTGWLDDPKPAKFGGGSYRLEIEVAEDVSEPAWFVRLVFMTRILMAAVMDKDEIEHFRDEIEVAQDAIGGDEAAQATEGGK